MKRILFLYLIVLVGLCSCEQDIPTKPIGEGNWIQLKDFPGKARASATSFVVGDKAYVCFGRTQANSGALNEVWEYDSRDSSWTRKNDFPGVPRVNTIAGVVGDKVYVGLGATGAYDLTSQFSDFYEYDSQTDTWTARKAFPGVAKNRLFCAVVNGCLYTTEGFTNVGFNNDTYQYNPQTDTWTQLADCPVAHSCTAGFQIDSVFYVGSGFRDTNRKDFFCYRPSTNTWKEVASLPQGRILSNGLTINGKGYVLLGRYWNGTQNGGRLLRDMVEYDPKTNAWTSRGNCLCAARQNATAFSINGKGYVLLGEDATHRLSDFWMFIP